jgi:hypothetical protein
MEIVEFAPEHAEAFRRLNEAWIAKYFAIEAKAASLARNQGPSTHIRGSRLHAPPSPYPNPLFAALGGEEAYRATSTTPTSTAAQWVAAAATTWPCQMARANFRRLFT